MCGNAIAMQHKVVMEARSWVGTRFLHQGRRKKDSQDNGGVDCLGVLMGVAHALALRDAAGDALCAHDVREYSKQPDPIALRSALGGALVVREVNVECGMADVVLLAVDGRAQHVAVVGEHDARLTLIHAYAPARKVVEHFFDDFWKSRVVARYGLPDCL